LVIDEAIAAGKFPEQRRRHYEGLMQRDSQAARQLIASLQSGLAPLPEHPRHTPTRSDAGRRIVAAATGGFVVVREAEGNVAASSSDSTPAAPPRSASGVIRHKSSFAIPLSESDEPASGLDYVRGNGPPTIAEQQAALEALGTGALPAGWFPEYRDEPRVQNRD
jgi:hypothetical protein